MYHEVPVGIFSFFLFWKKKETDLGMEFWGVCLLLFFLAFFFSKSLAPSWISDYIFYGLGKKKAFVFPMDF